MYAAEKAKKAWKLLDSREPSITVSDEEVILPYQTRSIFTSKFGVVYDSRQKVIAKHSPEFRPGA